VRNAPFSIGSFFGEGFVSRSKTRQGKARQGKHEIAFLSWGVWAWSVSHVITHTTSERVQIPSSPSFHFHSTHYNLHIHIHTNNYNYNYKANSSQIQINTCISTTKKILPIYLSPTKEVVKMADSAATSPVEGSHVYKFGVNMSCGGCSGAVKRVLQKLDGMHFFLPFFLSFALSLFHTSSQTPYYPSSTPPPPTFSPSSPSILSQHHLQVLHHLHTDLYEVEDVN